MTHPLREPSTFTCFYFQSFGKKYPRILLHLVIVRSAGEKVERLSKCSIRGNLIYRVPLIVSYCRVRDKVQITKHLPTGLIHLRMHCPAFLITDRNSFIVASIKTARESRDQQTHFQLSTSRLAWISDPFQSKNDCIT